MYRLILISTLTLYLLIVSAQAFGNRTATSIVLSTKEINAISKEYDARVEMKVQSGAPPASAPPAPTTTEDSAAPKVDPKLKGWKISARPLYNATVDALTIFQGKWKRRIVLLVGVTSNGGYGIAAAEILADNGYQVTLAVIPRYKSELLKEEAADRMWDAHLKDVSEKYTANIIVKDFREYAASKAATKAIAAYREQLMEDHKDILENTNITAEDRVARVQGREVSPKAKTLKEDLDMLLLRESRDLKDFLLELNLVNCTAIDSIVAAGFESAAEIEQRYVIRYDLAQAVSWHFNWRQAVCGLVTGSYDSLSNTTTECGYYHMTKDGTMAVTRIPDSHIPNFKVLITYPRESVMALEGIDLSKAYAVGGPSASHVGGPSAAVPNVAYQYLGTKMYVTVYVDPDHPDVSMANCIASEAKKRTRRNIIAAQDDDDAATLDAFVVGLNGEEDEYKNSGCVTGGFLRVYLPCPVAASVAYIAEIAEIPNYKDTAGSVDFNKAARVPPRYLSFAEYAAVFAQMGNRRTQK